MTAYPNEGFEFVAWSGAIRSTDNPTTVAIKRDLGVMALFTPLAPTPTPTRGPAPTPFPAPTPTPTNIFTVTSTVDAADANPGEGVCSDGSGRCTLRAAIMEANAFSGADTITLPAGTYTLTIVGIGEDAAASGDLDITDDLTVNGAGAADTIIDGGSLD